MTGPQSTEWIQTGMDDTRPAPAAPGPLASFAWFVLCGGGVSLAASAAVPWAAELLPWPVANALITVVTTLLCTELHALITFRTGRRAGWRRHLQSAGSATVAYVVTTAAVLTLDALQPSAGMFWQQAVYLGASGAAGIGRFLVLRLVVFADSRKTAEVRAQSPFPSENDPGEPSGMGIDKTIAEAGVVPPTRSARRHGASANLWRGSGQSAAARAMSPAASTPGASSGVRCPVPS